MEPGPAADLLIDALKHGGIASTLLAIAVLFSFNILIAVGKFVWDIIQKRNELSEASVQNLTTALQVNTAAVNELKTRITEVEKELTELPKVRMHLNRLFAAVKYMAKDDWPEIRKVIMDDSLDF